MRAAYCCAIQKFLDDTTVRSVRTSGTSNAECDKYFPQVKLMLDEPKFGLKFKEEK
jgi:hypothetical protein